MLTRRARRRTFLLRPSKRTNKIVAYVVAVVAARRNIQLHALVVMSNHWHVCLTDPDGAVVDFQRDCRQFIARAVNAYHGEFENLWSCGSPSRVECERADDLIERIAHTMANPGPRRRRQPARHRDPRAVAGAARVAVRNMWGRMPRPAAANPAS